MNSKLRTVLIWLASFSVVLAVFLLYVRKGQTPSIRSVSDSNFTHTIPGMNDRMDVNSGGQIGTVNIIDANKGRYVKRDENTGDVTQVFGWKSVLRMDGDLWELEKPYVEFLRPRFK